MKKQKFKMENLGLKASNPQPLLSRKGSLPNRKGATFDHWECVLLLVLLFWTSSASPFSKGGLRGIWSLQPLMFIESCVQQNLPYRQDTLRYQSTSSASSNSSAKNSDGFPVAGAPGAGQHANQQADDDCREGEAKQPFAVDEDGHILLKQAGRRLRPAGGGIN